MRAHTSLGQNMRAYGLVGAKHARIGKSIRVHIVYLDRNMRACSLLRAKHARTYST